MIPDLLALLKEESPSAPTIWGWDSPQTIWGSHNPVGAVTNPIWAGKMYF